jgi:nitrogen fixation NifU-like protein
MERVHGGSLLSEGDQEVLGRLDEEAVSAEVRRHAAEPSNMGRMENPDGEAMVSGICEDTMMIQLKLRGDRVEDARFQTWGCGFTTACASVATELARGKSVRHALGIRDKQIIEALGGLPREHTHCAGLAANALKEAVKDALYHRRFPWMKGHHS